MHMEAICLGAAFDGTLGYGVQGQGLVVDSIANHAGGTKMERLYHNDSLQCHPTKKRDPMSLLTAGKGKMASKYYEQAAACESVQIN